MVPKIPLDAKRWEGEMLEIANTYEKINLTPKFHQGAADIMDLANKTPIDQVGTRERIRSFYCYRRKSWSITARASC